MRIRYPTKKAFQQWDPDDWIASDTDLRFIGDGEDKIIKAGETIFWFEIEGDEDHIALLKQDKTGREYFEYDGEIFVVSKEYALMHFKRK